MMSTPKENAIWNAIWYSVYVLRCTVHPMFGPGQQQRELRIVKEFLGYCVMSFFANAIIRSVLFATTALFLETRSVTTLLFLLDVVLVVDFVGNDTIRNDTNNAILLVSSLGVDSFHTPTSSPTLG